MTRRKPDFRLEGRQGVYSVWVDTTKITINLSKKEGDRWKVIDKAVIYRQLGKGRKWLQMVTNKESHGYAVEEAT